MAHHLMLRLKMIDARSDGVEGGLARSKIAFDEKLAPMFRLKMNVEVAVYMELGIATVGGTVCPLTRSVFPVDEVSVSGKRINETLLTLR